MFSCKFHNKFELVVIIMDDSYKDSLNINTAAILTFGYDNEIVKKMDKKFYFVELSNTLFGKEFSILKSGKNNAVVGLRNIKLSSIVNDNIRMNYLKKLFRSGMYESLILDYASKFLEANGFEPNDKLLKSEYDKIKQLISNKKDSSNVIVSSVDDNDLNTIKNNENSLNNIEKNFSESVLKKVDIKRILSCDRICVQNMDTMGKLEPLNDEKAEELRMLVHLYTGSRYLIINKLLRGEVIPLFDNQSL